MHQVFTASAQKALGSEMPSCVRSFVLPIAYTLALIGDQTLLLHLLNSLFNGQTASLCAFFAKWIEYTGKMTGRARDVCYLGQASLLRLT